MPHVLEDLRRVFPKKSLLLQTYMLGCFYLIHQQLNCDEKKKEKQTMPIWRSKLIENQHQRHLKQFQLKILIDQQIPLKPQLKSSYGLMEFRTPQFVGFPNLEQPNSTSQVHTLQIDSKQIQNFSLDDLSTIESEFVPDLKTDLQIQKSVDMTQSCIF
ncbi:unnamed protein product (macronuclear) [Paramecium tetraurelia]|uniref:Uncharacterized protein n=1 Tax=Paramecium tetraurelia TaxID=5888 RepID=A0D1Q2_PARTE|nr:uncharacterized protein GSPATT00012493001 [Paramecium tetraurelia]CAK76969.1 unnamed protein product [Paramecium tetraurelia]|eukprot:XP_001444366.1 hypothetical protein (macronuclear) [Paramecium tetraurelia strain d4-2]